ncbi:MAG TPA: hypothetical protein VGF38_13390 [Ktedonobacterales bacterium]|jgi:hypothetical protein
MKVPFAVLADYASISIDGKLNAMGIFNIVFMASAPAVHPRMYIAWLFQHEEEDRGVSHHLEVTLRDPDGTVLFGVESDAQIPDAIPLPLTTPHVVEITGTRFEQFGEYAFSIELDGEQVANVPLRVAPLPTPQES